MYSVKNGLKCHDVHTKFHKDRLRHSKVDTEDTQTRRQEADRLAFFRKVVQHIQHILVGGMAYEMALTFTRRAQVWE
jgi:hypothetical protein